MIRQIFPTVSAMAIGHTGSYAEYGIEKQYTLFGPMCQFAMFRLWDANVLMDFFKNILEAWRDFTAATDGETQAMCLAFTMVGILPDDHDSNIFEIGHPERIEHVAA